MAGNERRFPGKARPAPASRRAIKALRCAAVAAALASARPGAAAPQLDFYGVVDAGVAATRQSGQGGSVRLLDGGLADSLWGLAGAESLGAGWRAGFRLESGFDPSSGAADDTRLFNYQAWVGLGRADLGELRLGRQYTVGRDFASALEIASWKDMGMGATFKAADNYQFSNMLNYLTPVWGGWQAGAGYAFDAGDQGRYATRDNDRALSAGLKYESGPLLAVATWERLRLADAPAGVGRPQAAQFGVSYDIEWVRLSAAWTRQRNGYVGLDGGDPDGLGLGLGPAAFARGGRADAYLLGASLPLGAGTVLIQGSIARPDWEWRGGMTARKAQVVTLGYTYDLSRRTTPYGFAGYARNYTLDNQFDPGGSRTARAGMGVSHRY